jgi:hypothetical protein
MMNTRKSEDVVQQLLDAMKTLVTKYHPTVRQTGSTLSDLIPGTARRGRKGDYRRGSGE